jgi:hypothetical protein
VGRVISALFVKKWIDIGKDLEEWGQVPSILQDLRHLNTSILTAGQKSTKLACYTLLNFLLPKNTTVDLLREVNKLDQEVFWNL